MNFLDDLLEPAIQAAGYRLVRLRVLGGKRKTLQIMAERPDGQMLIEDCAALSRKLSEVLEAADPITEEYVLEVSSPGIDRPLSGEGDFQRFAGHEARIEVAHPIEGRRRFKGSIAGVEDGNVLLDSAGDEGKKRIALPVSAISEAKLVLTDRLIQETLKSRDARASKQAVPEEGDAHRRH